MKRTFEQINPSKTSKIAPKTSQWSDNEDIALTTTAKFPKKGRKNCAKEHHKRMKNSRKNMEGPKTLLLVVPSHQGKDSEWTLNEDLLLLYACEHYMSDLETIFPCKEPQKRLRSFFLEIAQRAKNKSLTSSHDTSPLDTLKALLCLKAFLSGGDSMIGTIANDVAKEAGVTKEDCLALFSEVAPPRKSTSGVWNIESIKCCVDRIMENVANKFKERDEAIDLDGLIYVRSREEILAQCQPSQQDRLPSISQSVIQPQQQSDSNQMPMYYGYPCVYYFITTYCFYPYVV